MKAPEGFTLVTREEFFEYLTKGDKHLEVEMLTENNVYVSKWRLFGTSELYAWYSCGDTANRTALPCFWALPKVVATKIMRRRAKRLPM